MHGVQTLGGTTSQGGSVTAATFEVPDDLTAIDGLDDPKIWERHSWWVPVVASGWRWWLGDMILTSPDHDRFVALLNGTPGIESTDTVPAARVSAAFPPDRRRPELSWHHHHAVHKLPAHIADEILDAAVGASMTLEEVKKSAARTMEKASAPAPAGVVTRRDFKRADPIKGASQQDLFK